MFEMHAHMAVLVNYKLNHLTIDYERDSLFFYFMEIERAAPADNRVVAKIRD
jgi:hypothetical protein